jgi:hypothetical protein
VLLAKKQSLCVALSQNKRDKPGSSFSVDMAMNLLHNHFLQIYVLFLYTYSKNPGLSRLFCGVVVFRHHDVIIGIEMLSKWRHPSIVDRILKSISFPYPT